MKTRFNELIVVLKRMFKNEKIEEEKMNENLDNRKYVRYWA